MTGPTRHCTPNELASLLARTDTLPKGRRQAWARELGGIARRGLPGSLSGADLSLLERSLALLREAGLDDADLRAVIALWGRPRPAVGEAFFPVVLGDGTGLMCVLRVGWKSVLGEPPACDAAFSEAVSDARRWCVRTLRHGVEPGEALGWSVLPAVPLEGGSVGFAALAAWSSFLLAAPLPGDAAWTGCLRQEGGGLAVARVPSETLAAKVAAVEHMGLATLHLPVHNRDQPSAGLRVVPHAKVEDVAREGLAFAWRVPPPPPGTHAGVGELPPAAHRAMSVLEAADRPLPADVLSRAIFHPSAWRHAAGIGTAHLHEALRPLGEAVRETEGGYRLDPDAPITLGRHADPTWEADAHRALADLVSDPVTGTEHLALAGELAQARAALRTLLEDPREGRAVLERLEGRLGWDRVEALLVEIEPRGGPGLARLGWAGLGLPWPFSRAAAGLFRSREPTDALFATQALVECVLHGLAAVAVALRCTDREKNLERRPSVGDLARAALELLQPGGEQHAVRDALVRALAPERQRLAELGGRFNDALHRPGSLSRLAASPTWASERLEGLLPDVTALVEALRRELAPMAFGPRADAGEWDLVYAGGSLPLGRAVTTSGSGGALFHRGHLDGRPRYWSFESVESAWPDGAPFHATAPLPAPLARVNALPAPVAWVEAVRTRDATPIGRLARLDEHVAAVLRLAWFGAVVALPGRLAAPIRDSEHNWLTRMNHRNLLEEILTCEGAEVPAAFLCREPARSAMFRLVDGLERLGHAPGPLDRHEALLTELEGWLSTLHVEAPWSAGELVALDGARWLSVMGTRPTDATQPPLDRPGVPGEVVLVEGDRALSLGPFAVYREGRVWLLREAPGASTRKALARCRGTFYSAGSALPPATREWAFEPDPSGPWSTRVGERAGG